MCSSSGGTGALPSCLERVASRLEPSEEQRSSLERKAAEVIAALRRAVEQLNLSGVVKAVELQGSLARDTWLPDDVDLDVFILFDSGVSTEGLRELAGSISERAADELGASLETRYASHPYYVLKLREFEVEVVPAYYASSPEHIVSPVDRTPFHTSYVREALSRNPALKRDIRVFKRLLKNLRIYGAETWVGGFSGYLAELLVIYYGGLRRLLDDVVRWRPGRVFIPFTEEALKFKGAPLVVLDPVDRRRNAAAAVTRDALLKLVAAARLIAQKEDLLCCFLEPPRVAFDENMLREALTARAFLFVKAESRARTPTDAFKGRLSRVHRKLKSRLEEEGFLVYRARLLDLKAGPLIALELDQVSLPLHKKHLGPPVWSANALSFLEKWVRARQPVLVEGERWVAVVPRKRRSAGEVAADLLKVYRDCDWRILDAESLLEQYTLPEDRREIYLWALGVEEWMLCFQ